MNVAPVSNRVVVFPVPPVPPVPVVKRSDKADDGASRTPEPASGAAAARPSSGTAPGQGLGALLDIRV